MIVRELKPEDAESIKELHSASKQKYDVPELKDCITAYAVVDEQDVPRGTLLSRRTAEMYLILDHEWESPATRLAAVKALVEATKPRLIADGYSDAYAFLGPDIPKSYLRRLMELGARKMIWTCVHFLRGEM